MKKITLIFLMLCLGCSKVTPDAGQEAVLIEKPWFFGHGGVVDKAVTTGVVWVAPTTDHVIIQITPVEYKIHFDDLMSSDGVPIDFDAIIRLQVTNSVRLVRDFGGSEAYINNIFSEFRNRVRQAVRKHGMNETAISTKAIEEIDDEVTNSMQLYLKSIDFPAKLIQVTVGKANPPDSVKHQRIATASEQQRQETEKQKKLAEDQRKLSEESRAKADNAYREALQLSPEQFLRLESIHMQEKVCTKQGCTFIVNGSSINPVITVK